MLRPAVLLIAATLTALASAAEATWYKIEIGGTTLALGGYLQFTCESGKFALAGSVRVPFSDLSTPAVLEIYFDDEPIEKIDVVPKKNGTGVFELMLPSEERTLQLAHAALNAKREYGSRLVVFRKGVEARSRSDKPNTREVINAVALNSTTERADGERVEVANRSEMTNAREAISAVLRACKLPLPHQ